MPVNQTSVGTQIATQRKANGMTQSDLAERLNLSFQAVSKWERGETLPDTALLPDLAQILSTTVDNLLTGGERMLHYQGTVKMADLIEGVSCLRKAGQLLGKQNILYRGAIDGLSERINSDVEEMLADEVLFECLVVEAALHRLKLGYYIDPTDIKKQLKHGKWIEILLDTTKKHGIC